MTSALNAVDRCAQWPQEGETESSGDWPGLSSAAG